MAVSPYETEARRIISLLKRDFVLPSGALAMQRVGEDIFPHHILPDLGDVTPFLLYFGEREFIADQISILAATERDGLLVSEFPTFGISGLAKSYEYTDLLFGLLDCVQLGSPYDVGTVTKRAERAIQTFSLRGNISSFFVAKRKVRLPVIDTRDATFIEFFLDLHELTGDREYVAVAKNIFSVLFSLPYYERYGVLPDFGSRLVPWRAARLLGLAPFAQGTVCKNNSNALFALLALWDSERDADVLSVIERMVNVIMTRAATEDGGVRKVFSPGREQGDAYLTASFPMLDFSCDAFHLTGKPYFLEQAKRIAGYWLRRQGSTGLFPLWGGGNDSFFDSETDMSVALFKLHELSGNDSYREAAERCLEGIIRYHGERDYVLSVDVQSSSVRNETQRTKFLALFLKLLILKMEMEKGNRIYSNGFLLKMLRDR